MFLWLKKLLDRLLDTGLWMSMLVMTLTVLWQVFTRFVLGSPSSWTEELAIFLLIWIGLLGSAVALRRGSHLGIDILVNRLPERWGRLTAVFAYCCIIFFSTGVFFLGGLKMVAVVLMNNQISPALHIKMGYVYLALPISGFFLNLYAVEFVIEELLILTGRGKVSSVEAERLKVSLD
ncbi:MAG: TRAP transporter small permease [Candidatus Glassbacteria bacterium]